MKQTIRSPHLSLAHNYWKELLRPSDLAVDMTCGNGHDTLFLCELLTDGKVIGVDIQPAALENTRGLLAANGIEKERFSLLLQSHADPLPLPCPPRLFVYNLGYLPGGDKSVTTRVESTLASLEFAAEQLAVDGALSITCYPGHEAGKEEEEALLNRLQTFSSQKWQICHHQWVNKCLAPSLLLIKRIS